MNTGYREYSKTRDVFPVYPASGSFQSKDSMMFSYTEFVDILGFLCQQKARDRIQVLRDALTLYQKQSWAIALLTPDRFAP